MKKLLVIYLFASALLCLPVRGSAQDPITLIIKAAIKKAVQAADLRIQRLQNRTIALQNAQKQLEIELNKQKLSSIHGWVAQQKELYKDYYDELLQVREAIKDAEAVAGIVKTGRSIVEAYRESIGGIGAGDLLSAAERQRVISIYKGMLREGSRGVEALYPLLQPGILQMTDAERAQAIAEVEGGLQKILRDLQDFSTQNKVLLRQRAIERASVKKLKKIYQP